MSGFSSEIFDFQKNGNYNYVFDEGGNLIFQPSSSNFNQTFVSLPLTNYYYDDVKIKSFYNLEFSEFTVSKVVDVGNNSTVEVQQLSQENIELKDRLEKLTEISNLNITESERLAIKQIILELRVQLGQGIVNEDFSPEFPYLPVKIES
jgi:hypothetical protein